MRHTSAFSLVELSIVLVILGLLVGGVLTGQSLIRAAELRSVTTDLQRYQTAVQTFRDRFFALPGDMRNAVDFWGAAANCPGTNTQPSTDATTCNGNGDGQANTNEGSGNGNAAFRFWQHLANAGLIEGTYTGVVAGTGNSLFGAAGLNIPRIKFGNSNGVYPNYIGSRDSSDGDYFAGNYGNPFRIYRGTTSGVDSSNIGAEDQWNIDTKLDDGRPGTGIVRAREGQVNCVSTTDPATAEYRVTLNASLGCQIIYITGF